MNSVATATGMVAALPRRDLHAAAALAVRRRRHRRRRDHLHRRRPGRAGAAGCRGASRRTSSARTTACGRSTARWRTRWPPAGCTASARSPRCRRWPPRSPGLAAHRMVLGINSLLVLVIVRHTDKHEVAGLGTAALFAVSAGGGAVPRRRGDARCRPPVGPLRHRQRRAGLRRGGPARRVRAGSCR